MRLPYPTTSAYKLAHYLYNTFPQAEENCLSFLVDNGMQHNSALVCFQNMIDEDQLVFNEGKYDIAHEFRKHFKSSVPKKKGSIATSRQTPEFKPWSGKAKFWRDDMQAHFLSSGTSPDPILEGAEK